MEDELDMRLLALDHGADILVERGKKINIRAPPWLVDRLDSIDSWVVAPSVKKTLNGVLGKVDVVHVGVLVVKAVVATFCLVIFAHPLTEGVVPMVEVVFIGPGGVVADSGVIISVLAALHTVHVEQDLDVILLGGVEEPGDLVLGALSAADVWAVWLESPVTHGESDNLDVSGGHLDEVVLSDPLVPMLTQDCVALIRSEGRAEGVLVHADLLWAWLIEEPVEEGWGDPWLEDHPATNVGADHGFLVSGLLGEGGGGKSCNSKGLHLDFLKIYYNLNESLTLLSKHARYRSYYM